MNNPVRSVDSRPPLILYDDATARTFEPFALTRPIGTLISGTASIQERWSTALQLSCAGTIAAEHLADFDEDCGVVQGTLAAGTVVANSRFAPAVEMLWLRDRDEERTHKEADVHAGSWSCDGRVTAVRLARAVAVGDFVDGTLTLDSLIPKGERSAPISGLWHDEVWDFIRHLPKMLADDILRFHAMPQMKQHIADRWMPPKGVSVIGDHPVLVASRSARKDLQHLLPAVIEPHVVLDATAGPILIEPGAHIHPFTRIVGPCRIGMGATIMGGDISGCSIGPVCKIRGEISSSIVLGYSNKGHEGFVGHSYLGRWVNLGAGTTTSNLKNTYGSVALWTKDGIRDTGLQFLGTLFGDHVKTGIGTMLTTGTVLGAAANVYGTAMPPKAVAPFSWGEGEPYATYRLDKFLETTETVMGRRKLSLSDRARAQLSASFEKRWSVEAGGPGARGKAK